MLSPHRLLLWSLVVSLLLSSPAAAQEAEQQQLEVLDEAPDGQRRQLWDFFSLLFLLGPGKCVIGPLGENCRNGNGNNGNDADDTQAAAASYSEYNAADYEKVEVSEAVDGADYNEEKTASGGAFGNVSNGFQFWMIATAGSVLSALVAINIGQRKNRASEDRHEMSGAVSRRIGTVSALADGAFHGPGNSEGTGAKSMEMSRQEVTPEYKLDFGPEGVETEPSFDIV